MRWIVFIVVTICLFVSCKKYERTNPLDGIAGVKTGAVNQLSLSSVEITSSLSEIKDVQQVTQRGVCWSTHPSPTTADDFETQGSGFGTYTTQISTLEANKTYYFRAFASNEKTTAYGNEVIFILRAPIIKTNQVNAVTYTSAKVGGVLSDDNGFQVTEKGIVWGEYPGLTYENTRLQADQNTFDFQLTGLENGKTYYYKAYVNTNYGIAYGKEMIFNTLGYNTPSLTTKLVTNIGTNSAVSGGEITSDGGLAITEKGVCWSTTTNPTIADNKSMEGAGTDSYTSKLDGLEDGVTYYVRAYATNSKGTSYGNEESFTTFAFYKPTLTTNSISNISATDAVSGGVISSDGGASITAKGICWSTTSNPTITSNKTNDGSGSLSFTSQLSGLQEGTKYYVRAYATNSKGTSYGNEESFTTFAFDKPTLTTNSISNISATGAISGGVISSDGGTSITAKGVCWSTSSNPTITGNKTNDGSGSLNFTSQLSGLQEVTEYYVRAYATNSKGTSYGNEVSFTTSNQTIGKPGPNITDVEGNSYKTVTIGTQTWMAENLKTSKYSDGTTIPNITDNTQWKYNTTGAWCYYDNNSANNSKYGKLYNWYAVSPTTNGNKNVCPTGWHVPSDAEWTVLTDYLGGESVAGGKMKEVGTTNWNSPNTDATNTSLFTGLPGGYRDGDGGNYYSIGYRGYWRSSTEGNTGIAWFLYLYYSDGNANSGYYGKRAGLSVRCLRD